MTARIVALAALVTGALIGGAAAPAGAAFAGSIGLIIFDAGGPNYGDRELWTLDPNAPDPETTITKVCCNNTLVFDGIPVWSPPGKPSKIIFARGGAHFRNPPYDLYIANADGSNQTQLTNNAANDYNAAWAPANVTIHGGKWFIFTSDRLGHYQTYIKQLGTPLGSEKLMAGADTGFNDQFPEWSPDGRWVAFTRSPLGGGNDDVYVQGVNVNKNPPKLAGPAIQLTNSTFEDRYPSWAPTSDKLVYQNNATAANTWKLWTVNIATPLVVSQLTVGLSSDHHAVWSPDGTVILYESNRNGQPDNLFTIPIGGGQSTQLTFDAGLHGHPDWQALP
jgi:TolB protein